MKKRTLGLVAAVAVAASFTAAPATAQDDADLTIASSLPWYGFPFFVHMQKEIDAKAAELGVAINATDGENTVEKQTADVEAAVTRPDDGILISPGDVAGMQPAIQAAIDAGIPVVTVDRRVEGVDGLLAHVGADNVKGGEAQGLLIMERFPDGATIVNLQGQPGASAAIERNQGVHNILDAEPDKYVFVQEETAEFDLATAVTVTENILTGLAEPPDVIVAANDSMALGALQVATEQGLDIAILGFDALPEALESVRDGGLLATVEQFPGGQSTTALEILVNFLRDGTMPESDLVLLTPVTITAENIDVAERLGELGE
jgi:ABC-type sugar transport system substrate-binding protein